MAFVKAALHVEVEFMQSTLIMSGMECDDNDDGEL